MIGYTWGQVNSVAGAMLDASPDLSHEELPPMTVSEHTIPERPCSNCGLPYSPLRRGRCQRCSQYWRRHAVERPASLLSCACGTCPTCRSRENARRRTAGVTFTHLAIGRFDPPETVVPTDPATLGYLAGLMDGEGCISRNNKCWRVQIAMTDEAVIRWLGSFGGRVSERKLYGNRKPCWRWLLMRQEDVYRFLAAILPHMRVKTDQAIVALAEIDQRRRLRFAPREVG